MTVAFKGAFVTLKHKFGRAIVIKKKKKKTGKREIMCKDWWQQIQEFFFPLEDRTDTLWVLSQREDLE